VSASPLYLKAAGESRAARLFGIASQVESSELRALGVAFLCHFVLLASYCILRPLRDTMATVFGVAQLQYLLTVTFVVYRFGDVSAAWVQAGLRAAGFGLAGALILALAASTAWGAAVLALGRRYGRLWQMQTSLSLRNSA
jgi:ATP/ADP translocase